MNKCIFMGRLTRDPEVRYGGANGDTAVARYSIAVDRRRKRDGDPEADFFNCVSFGKQAEFIEKYLRKGTKIVVEGELRNNNYTNRNGEKVYAIDVVVSSVEFAESKAASERNGGDYGSGTQGGGGGYRSGGQTDNDGFMDIPEDGDLPF